MKIHSLLSLLLLSAGTASIASLGPAAEKKFNVLFIAADDLRPDLGCYGHPMVKSPNIDALAKRGLVLDRAYCQQAVCNPSRASLLTGLRPENTGVIQLPIFFRDKVPDAITLPQHFKANGYFTQSFGKIFHTAHGNRDDALSWSVGPFSANKARGEGSDTEGGPATPGAGKSKSTAAPHPSTIKATSSGSGALTEGRPAFAAPDVADSTQPDALIADRAIAALREHKDGPFFLAVGFLKPHLPFIAPKKYWDLYSPSDITLAANPNPPKDAPLWAGNGAGEMKLYGGIPKQGPVPDATARQLIHGYWACISFIDAQVGRVLAELDRLGLRENTIVILWGDHGWHLGEQGTWSKHTAWELATRAPLILSVPGQKNAGQKSTALVEFVDIYPTLAELCGLPAPQKIEGTSFTPLLADPQRPWKKAAFSVWPKKTPDGQRMGYAIRTDRYRLVEWRGHGNDAGKLAPVLELYDHQTDPGENVNLAAQPAQAVLVAQLTQQLHEGWRAARP